MLLNLAASAVPRLILCIPSVMMFDSPFDSLKHLAVLSTCPLFFDRVKHDNVSIAQIIIFSKHHQVKVMHHIGCHKRGSTSNVPTWPLKVTTECLYEFTVTVLSTLPRDTHQFTFSPGENWCAESKGVWRRRRWGGWICLAVGTASEGSPPLLEVKFTHTHTPGPWFNKTKNYMV